MDLTDKQPDKLVIRGEVWWANIYEKCPVVLLSRSDDRMIRAMMVVAPASMPIDGVAIEVKVGMAEGFTFDGVVRVALPHPGRINCSWLVTLADTDLLEQAGVLPPHKLRQFDDALSSAGIE